MPDYLFAYPRFLLLLVLIIPMIVWYILKQKKTVPTIQLSTLQGFGKAKTSFKNILKHIIFAFRIICFSFLVLALARPQSTNNWQNVSTEGIDIIISLDISGSMLAQDFHPDRLEAGKTIAAEFINNRPNDRMGLVVFSGKSFTQCPLTTDHAVLINLFKGIKFGLIEDGTAIGEGIATAINRIKDSNAKSKIIILLTDGVNNSGSIAPITAAEIAKTYGIRIYTIGVGSLGQAPYPVPTAFGTQMQMIKVEIDEPALKQIAQMTDGKYFRATNNEKLREIYKEIDKLEKTKIAVKEYRKYKEEFLPFVLLAALSLFLELFLKFTILKKIP
ncbi:MAG: aerotolerance regulator BatA [Bacteroidetes bacterium CG23_combo_of_CG06-09_8_20_14_all_32_9]|nr:MAG: aerotolerance regulator BatA [Bacteroidetes bacterium CG23_combo_of_CG06-09_8_20_14_all_32_9]